MEEYDGCKQLAEEMQLQGERIVIGNLAYGCIKIHVVVDLSVKFCRHSCAGKQLIPESSRKQTEQTPLSATRSASKTLRQRRLSQAEWK